MPTVASSLKNEQVNLIPYGQPKTLLSLTTIVKVGIMLGKGSGRRRGAWTRALRT